MYICNTGPDMLGSRTLISTSRTRLGMKWLPIGILLSRLLMHNVLSSLIYGPESARSRGPLVWDTLQLTFSFRISRRSGCISLFDKTSDSVIAVPMYIFLT